MRVLVLGGTQFVSEAAAKGLIARGHEVAILTRGKRPVTYDGLVEHVVADRGDKASMRRLRGRRFDAVLDCSGYRAQDVASVLESLRPEAGTHYIFLSSGAVYRPADAPVAEDAPKGENEHWGPYGLGKLEAEELLERERVRLGFELSIVRPAYVYGPGNNLYREAFFFDRIARDLPVPIPASDARTQFVCIDDMAGALVRVAERDEGAGALNYANPQPVGWRELVEAAGAALGRSARIQPVEYRGRMEAREFFPFRDCTYLLDMGKLERLGLGMPKTDLAEGMRRACEWWRQTRPELVDAKMARVDEALVEPAR